MELSENKQRMAHGELYYAFTPELVAERARCKHACARYNNAGEVSRRKLTELFREYVLLSESLTEVHRFSHLVQHYTGQDAAATTSLYCR